MKPIFDHIDLCAGFGGFSLACEWAGIRTVGQIEINTYCRKVLKKHWPHVVRLTDVKLAAKYPFLVERMINETLRRIKAEPAPGRIISAGYPCQPFSPAGKRRGEADDRHLWPFIFPIIERFRPDWCLFENSAGHIKLGIDTVLSALESIGYSCGTLVIPAVAVQAPHRRDRVWIIAHSDSPGCPKQHAATVTEKQGQYSGIPSKDNVSNSNNWGGVVRRNGSLSTIENTRSGGSYYRGRTSPTEPGKWWSFEPGVGRVAYGVPHRVERIEGLGSAIVPILANKILLAIIQAECNQRQGLQLMDDATPYIQIEEN